MAHKDNSLGTGSEPKTSSLEEKVKEKRPATWQGNVQGGKRTACILERRALAAKNKKGKPHMPVPGKEIKQGGDLLCEGGGGGGE